METEPGVLPLTGYVLAGGRSSRMGSDKAGLLFRGRPLVELAVEKLARFCQKVSIAGNRDDLRHVAPVVKETRVSVGPAAGIEAGLRDARNQWCLFVPVDVPLLPGELLRGWAMDVLKAENAGLRASYLVSNGQAQPSICMWHPDCLDTVVHSLNRGERRLKNLLHGVDLDLGAGSLAVKDAADYAPPGNTAEEVTWWFLNVNTPEEFAEAERQGVGIRD